MSATFYHRSIPSINLGAGMATVVVYAVQTDPQVVILDDQDGDSHDVPIDPNGATPQDKARPGVVALVVDIAGSRGLTLEAADVAEVAAP